MSNTARIPEFDLEENSLLKTQLLEPRLVELTPRSGISIERTLPHRKIRTIGAWCFVDAYGPTNQEKAMQVAAHPHTGLQTVTWLFSGEVEHRDSLGSIQTIKPGELNLMTAGSGISHSELSINTKTDLHGVQLWIVLSNQARNQPPSFHHYQDLPGFKLEHIHAKVFVGEFGGVESTANVYSELVGAELNFLSNGSESFKLKKTFEYGLLVISGEIFVFDEVVPKGNLLYICPGQEAIEITGEEGARIIFLGGEPFSEAIVMWWNFIGRSHAEIAQMRLDWEERNSRFGQFTDAIGGRIPAPPMPALTLTPRGRS